MDRILQAKKEVLETAKNAFALRLFAGTSGNLSSILRPEGLIVITPTNTRYESMELEDIVVVDMAGNVVDGKHRPSSEYPMHRALYEGRPDVNSVVHTHSPYATAFAVNNRNIPLILIEMLPFLGGEVQVAPIQPAGSEDLGRSVLDTIGSKNCCLMANHGVVALGTTMAQAYIRAEYVEDAAKICSIAMQNGEIVLIPPAMVQRQLGG